MILADKIILLRKEQNMSQEELAAKLGVSRQAVSKWESAGSIPDLDKILKLSALFGVSTDYLLKDDIEIKELSMEVPEEIRQLSFEEANGYLSWKEKLAHLISSGTFLCILSPLALIISEYFGIQSGLEKTKHEMTLIGFGIMFFMIAIAVGLFIYSGVQNEKYKTIEKETFELSYGVKGILLEKKKAFSKIFILSIIFGTGLCLAAAYCIIASSLAYPDNVKNTIILFGAFLFLVSIACILFIHAGIQDEAFNILLMDEKEQKRRQKIEWISSIYWIIITAIYLLISFLTNRWQYTWIIWCISALIWAVVEEIYKHKSIKSDNN